MERETGRIALARSVRELVGCVRLCGDRENWAFRLDAPAALDWTTNELPNGRDPQPLEDAYRTGGLYWNLVSDLALSVADLVETERRIGALVASRSLAESAARMWYLLADDLAPAERIRRVVNDRLSGLYEDWRMSKDTALLDATWQASARDAILVAYQQAGYMVTKENRHASAYLDPTRPSAMGLLGDLVGHSGGAGLFYRLASALAHANLHGLVKETDLIPDETGALRGHLARPPVSRDATDISPAIYCTVFAANQLLAQAGWMCEEFVTSSETLRRVLFTLIDEPSAEQSNSIPVSWT